MKRRLSLLLLFTLLLNLALTTAPVQAKTAAAPAAQLTTEDVRAVTLDNGLQILLVERPNMPVAIVDIWVGVGSVNEEPSLNGIAHFFEHMIFKGSEARLGTVDQEVDGLGGQTNAATSFDWTHYYINVPSEQIDQAIDILTDSLVNGAFPADELELEREVVLREGDQRDDDPNSFLARQFYQAFYGDSLYGLSILGTPESLANITREAFLEFLATYYVPNNMTVVVAGDIDSAATLAMLEEKLGALEPKPLPPFEPQLPTPRTEPEVIEIERDVRLGYMIYGWPAPSIQERDDVVAMDVLLQVLSGGRGSRFYQNIVKELGIVNSADAGYFTTNYPGVFTLSAEFPYENRALVEDALFTELQRILDGDLNEAELARAQTILIAAAQFGHETNAGLAQSLGFYAVVGDDYTFAIDYEERVRAVTVDDVLAVARKYIDPAAYLQMVLIPQGQAETAAQEMEDLIVLDNGLRLILREDTGTESVAVQAFVGTGTAVESAEQAGTSQLTQRLLLRGTETMSEEELFEAIENLGASLSQSQLTDMGTLSLVATAETWQDALPLYLDTLLTPAFTQAEFQSVQEEMSRALQGRADDNFSIIYDNLQKTLYGEGGYGNPDLGTVESISNLTLDDVKAFYAKYYVPNNLVLSAAGNFNAALLRKKLETRLSTLTAGEENLRPTPTLQPLSDNGSVTSDKESNLTWFMLGFPAPAVADPDYPAMKVLNSVLGGGMSSRLFATLREEQGLAYSTSSFYPSRAGDSHLVTYVIALPENAGKAKEGMLAILEDIKANGVSDEELQRAINKEIGSFILRRETAQRRSYDIGWYEMLGAGIDLDATYPDKLRAVTSADVQRVATTYLTNYVLSSVGPGVEE
ncbi:MAG: M16 family metallopeptidase [Caldilineaceae bacterium]